MSSGKIGKLIRRTGLVLLAVVGLACAWFFIPRRADLRGFDPAGTAYLETRMWRSYYEKRPAALALDLYRLSRREYGFSPWDSVRIAWYAAQAALAFQPAHSRQEAQVALPSLENFFRLLRKGIDTNFDPAEAAREELDWWQRRREKEDWQTYSIAAARVTSTIYGTGSGYVLQAARFRCEMMYERDRSQGVMTDADWVRIEKGLNKAWTALKKAVSQQQ